MIHGVPLATLAYLVADVSLHSHKERGTDMRRNIVLDEDVSQLGNRYEQVSKEGLTRNEQIIQDIESGMSIKAIAATYGLSERRIRQILKEGNSANNNL
jgi:DNA-binding NarL/FixJ family response regulator